MELMGSLLTSVPVSGAESSIVKNLLSRDEPSAKDLTSPCVRTGRAVGEFLFEKLKEHVASPIGLGPALVYADTDRSVSFQALLSASVRAARGWRARGLKVGDTVAILSQEDLTPEFIGALFEGLAVAFLLPCWKKGELRRALVAVAPRVIVADLDTVSVALDAVGSLGSDLDCVIVTAGSRASKTQTLDSFLGLAEDSQEGEAYEPVRMADLREHVAVIEFTSGSTGLPKPIAVSYYACYMDCLHPRAWTAYGCHPEYTVMVESTQSWSVFAMVKLVCVAAGLKQVLVTLPSPAETLRILHKYQVSSWFTSPKYIMQLAEEVSRMPRRPDLRSVRSVTSIGAPMSAESQRAATAALGFPVYQRYGSTEAGVVATDAVSAAAPVFGSVGKPLPWVQLKIVDTNTNTEIKTNGQIGEIRVKTPAMMSGYLHDLEETTKAFDEEDFFKTSDLGYMDNTGHVFIVDRIRNVLKYDWEMIYPAEIEDVLLKHDGVLEAYVGGRPHSRLGELPTALVVKKPSSAVTAEELKDYVAERLSDVKELRGGVFFVEPSSFFITERGKVNRAEIKRRLRAMPSVEDESDDPI